jgi:hypothetical protein
MEVLLWGKGADSHSVTCPTQTNTSTQTGDPDTHDDDVHGCGQLRPAAAIL